MHQATDSPAGSTKAPGSRPPFANASGERLCRLCSRALSGLQRARGDLCDAMDCRRRASDDHRKAVRDAALDAARQGAAQQWAMPRLHEAPVVWLTDHERRLVPLTPAERDEHRAFLQGLECTAQGPDPLPEAALAETGDGPTAGNRLCALCSGRCCHAGGHQYAFLRGAQLRRWLARHPDTTWADAVDDYMRWMPSHHVDYSCVNHGERGCTLPREMRADICNDYACDPLERVDALARLDPAVVVVAGIVGNHALVEATMVCAQELRTLPASPAVREGSAPTA
jgi:hypothetical protein